MSTVLLDDHLAWPLSFELYLPQAWCTDARAADQGAHSRRRLRFREKWRIALAHIRQVLKAGFHLTAVVTDADYGARTRVSPGPRAVGVALRDRVAAHGGALDLRRPAHAHRRGHRRPRCPRPTGSASRGPTGTKGPLAARFAAVRVRPAKSRGDRWLLCERSLADDARKYYLLNLDATASLHDLVTVARSRWPIEQQYRELKDELGVDHFEGRSYRGWAHHTVLTAVAFTFLQLERSRSDDDTASHAPDGPTLGARNHGGALCRHQSQVVESTRQLPAESTAEKVTK